MTFFNLCALARTAGQHVFGKGSNADASLRVMRALLSTEWSLSVGRSVASLTVRYLTPAAAAATTMARPTIFFKGREAVFLISWPISSKAGLAIIEPPRHFYTDGVSFSHDGSNAGNPLGTWVSALSALNCSIHIS